jgi:hypothetical protein
MLFVASVESQGARVLDCFGGRDDFVKIHRTGLPVAI